MSRFPCTDCQKGEEDAEVTWHSEVEFKLKKYHKLNSVEYGMFSSPENHTTVRISHKDIFHYHNKGGDIFNPITTP